MTSNFKGVITALATPFFRGEIDFASFRKLVKHQVDGGVSGLVVAGTTGEGPTLTAIEIEELVSFVKSEVAGAVPVIVGTGSNSTRLSIDATLRARRLGADAAMVVVPYYNKPSQRGLCEHFEAVARASDLPIIVYNVPSRTITALSLDSLKKLSQVPGIVAVKEATGDLEFGRSVVDATEKSGLTVLSGDDGSFLDLMNLGAKGVISVISNLIPKELSEMSIQAAAGGHARAKESFAKIFGELNSVLYREANPIPVKYALARMGIFRSAELRLPLTELDAAYVPLVDQALQRAGLL